MPPTRSSSMNYGRKSTSSSFVRNAPVRPRAKSMIRYAGRYLGVDRLQTNDADFAVRGHYDKAPPIDARDSAIEKWVQGKQLGATDAEKAAIDKAVSSCPPPPPAISPFNFARACNAPDSQTALSPGPAAPNHVSDTTLTPPTRLRWPAVFWRVCFRAACYSVRLQRHCAAAHAKTILMQHHDRLDKDGNLASDVFTSLIDEVTGLLTMCGVSRLPRLRSGKHGESRFDACHNAAFDSSSLDAVPFNITRAKVPPWL